MSVSSDKCKKFFIFKKVLDKRFYLIYNSKRCKAQRLYIVCCNGGLSVNKNLDMSILLDLYGGLLTDKQRDVLELYYNDDLSLAEIAEQYDISRQGVHDSIKRGEEALLGYEKVLGLREQQEQYKKQLVQFKEMALEVFEECKKVSFGRNIAEKTITLLETLDSKLADFDNSKYLED